MEREHHSDLRICPQTLLEHRHLHGHQFPCLRHETRNHSLNLRQIFGSSFKYPHTHQRPPRKDETVHLRHMGYESLASYYREAFQSCFRIDLPS